MKKYDNIEKSLFINFISMWFEAQSVPDKNMGNVSTRFQDTLNIMLQDGVIDPEEANVLLKKFDLSKAKEIAMTQKQLNMLKAQFWDKLDATAFKATIERQAGYSLKKVEVDTELMYDGLTDFMDFSESGNISIDVSHPVKPEKISEQQWKEAQGLLQLAKTTWIKDGNISFTKENGIVLELDTDGSNVYVKKIWSEIMITGQEAWKLFVEKVSVQDFQQFMKSYNTAESKRVFEQLWFVWWLTAGGALSFSLRTGVTLLLGVIGTWLWLMRWYDVYKWYNLSKNDAVNVLKDFKENKEMVKAYLKLSQNWYIESYNNGMFETVDGEQLSAEEMFIRSKTMGNSVLKQYQLLASLDTRGIPSKNIGDWKYELDMWWLWDASPLTFEKWKIIFSTSKFENEMPLRFDRAEDAYRTIQKVNEFLRVQSDFKYMSTERDDDVTSLDPLKERLEKLKKDILRYS